jgi:transposase-like protein
VTETNVFQLAQPGTFTDSLTEVLRNGARALLAQAVEAEVAEFLAQHADLKTDGGYRRVVRHGHLPEREIMTGIGTVAVRQPRVRDRAPGRGEGERIRFSPSILLPYARRAKSLDVLIPVLYLKGISTGDFAEVLAALVGKDTPGLSASTIARLKEAWTEEHVQWSRRDLSATRYVYFWVDGIYLEARLEDQAQCILVIIGATPEGKKELVGFTDGVRESAESWRGLLLDLKRCGLSVAPELAVADGALGFWKALGEVWPTTREQRCWVHKTANVPQQAAQEPAGESQARASGNLDGRDQERRARRARHVRGHLWGKIREGRRLPDQGSQRPLGVLRLPGRALAALANDQSDREHVRDSPAQDDPIEGLSVEQDRACHGVQVGRNRAEKLAAPARLQSVAKSHPRGEVHRRNRGRQIASSSCRLTPPVTKIRR